MSRQFHASQGLLALVDFARTRRVPSEPLEFSRILGCLQIATQSKLTFPRERSRVLSRRMEAGVDREIIRAVLFRPATSSGAALRVLRNRVEDRAQELTRIQKSDSAVCRGLADF
jgi:hypothetical protein